MQRPFLLIALVLLATMPSDALPQFARRYNVDCKMCHTIPPRLNNFGEAFLRRGFKMQWDEKLLGQKLQEYFSTQTTVDYNAPSPPPAGGPASTFTDTQIGFFSAGPLSPQLSWYGELDVNPANWASTIHEGKAIIFWPTKVTDDQEKYYSLSVGAIRPLSLWQKELNESRTVETAMIFNLAPQGGFSFIPDNPQYGAEISYNLGRLTANPSNTYFTAAVTSGLQVNAAGASAAAADPGGPSGLSPNTNPGVDFQAQVAHYWGQRNSIALMYYSGNMQFSAGDPPGGDVTQFPFLQTNGIVNNHYNRFYLNGNWSPNLNVDLLGGVMVGNDSSNPVDGTSAATNGGFVEANYYFNPKSNTYPKYVMTGRYDTMNLAAGQTGQMQNDVVFALEGQMWRNILLTLERSETHNSDGSHTGTTIFDFRFIW